MFTFYYEKSVYFFNLLKFCSYALRIIVFIRGCDVCCKMVWNDSFSELNWELQCFQIASSRGLCTVGLDLSESVSGELSDYLKSDSILIVPSGTEKPLFLGRLRQIISTSFLYIFNVRFVQTGLRAIHHQLDV